MQAGNVKFNKGSYTLVLNWTSDPHIAKYHDEMIRLHLRKIIRKNKMKGK